MLSDLPLQQGIALVFGGPPPGQPYATSQLQRGLLLMDGRDPLCDEAIGFGVPVLKRGLQTIFPGGATFVIEQQGSARVIRAVFRLNRVERLSRSAEGIVRGPALYAAKDVLAATIRRLPLSRSFLTGASSQLRHLFGWETYYADAGFETEVSVTAVAEAQTGRLHFDVDCGGVRHDVTEVVLMHEQGAHSFDRYRDSSGLFLQGSRIGCWDEVRAAEACFESTSRKIAFKLGQVENARLFRGRELVGSRLAWAGFGYSFRPALRRIHHEMTISRFA